jgi:hypothetical protein
MQLTINDQIYAIGKIDAVKQFHVARRLAPALVALGGAAIVVLKQGGALTDAAAVASIGPLVEVIAGMSDDDSEYVLRACLAVVSRRSGDGWAPVQNAQGGLMFQDVDMSVMLRLTFAVIKDNLGNFMLALPGTAPESTPSA